jgi:hypothetical protein
LLILSGVAALIVNFALEERKGDNKNVKGSDA